MPGLLTVAMFVNWNMFNEKRNVIRLSNIILKIYKYVLLKNILHGFVARRSPVRCDALASGALQ